MNVLTASAVVAATIASLVSCKTFAPCAEGTTKTLIPSPGFQALILERSYSQDITIGGSPSFNLTVAIFTEAMCENECRTVEGVSKIVDGTFHFHIQDKGSRHGNHSTIASASAKIILTPDIKRIHISTYQGSERMIEINPNTSIVEGLGTLESGLVAIGGETSGKGFKILDRVYELDTDDHLTLLQTDKHFGMVVRVAGTLVKKSGGVETSNSNKLRTTSVRAE
jgi:hypothetical protein